MFENHKYGHIICHNSTIPSKHSEIPSHVIHIQCLNSPVTHHFDSCLTWSTHVVCCTTDFCISNHPTICLPFILLVNQSTNQSTYLSIDPSSISTTVWSFDSPNVNSQRKHTWWAMAWSHWEWLDFIVRSVSCQIIDQTVNQPTKSSTTTNSHLVWLSSCYVLLSFPRIRICSYSAFIGCWGSSIQSSRPPNEGWS